MEDSDEDDIWNYKISKKPLKKQKSGVRLKTNTPRSLEMHIQTSKAAISKGSFFKTEMNGTEKYHPLELVFFLFNFLSAKYVKCF